MSQVKSDIYTTDYILSLPEGQRVELIEGIIYDLASPSLTHQLITTNLSAEIRDYIKRKQGECKVISAPFGVFLNEDDKTYVEPDVLVVCDKNKLNEKGCMGAPDFVVEVVSPSSQKMDYGIKNVLYSNAGVREYWIIDPQKESTIVYRYEEGAAPTFFPFNQSITVGIYGDLNITISDLLE